MNIERMFADKIWEKLTFEQRAKILRVIWPTDFVGVVAGTAHKEWYEISQTTKELLYKVDWDATL